MPGQDDGTQKRSVPSWKKSTVTVIGGIVFLNKVADIDLVLPISAVKIVPCVHIFSSYFDFGCPLLGNKKGQHRIICDTAQTVGIEMQLPCI